MAPDNHDLVHEIPEHREKIHALKISSHHFAKLYDEYSALDHKIRQLEGEGIPVADETFEEMKRQRLNLKDELYKMLAQ